MNQVRRPTPCRLFPALFLILITVPTLAAVPLASREADRQAKFAAPTAKEAFIYVYRPADSSDAPLAVVLNGRDTARLGPRTFAMWKVRPGRIELTTQGSASALTLRLQGGHVYYVELSRLRSGVPVLRLVSFPVGRSEIHRARLVDMAKGAPPPVAPKPRAVPKPPAAPKPPAPKPAHAVPPRRQRADTFALTIKPGSFKIATDAQTLILGPTTFALQFDSTSSSVFGVEGEWYVQPDISVGAEVIKFANDFTDLNSSGSGSTDTAALMANAKRYFLSASDWQPYIGAGVGAAVVDFSGMSVTGSTSGIALQVVAGVQWRRQQLALRAEYKYLKADTEDDSGQKVDMTGSGLFLGIGFYF